MSVPYITIGIVFMRAVTWKEKSHVWIYLMHLSADNQCSAAACTIYNLMVSVAFLPDYVILPFVHAHAYNMQRKLVFICYNREIAIVRQKLSTPV